MNRGTNQILNMGGVRMCYKFKFSVGKVDVNMRAFAPNETKQYGISNWSLRPIQKKRDVQKNRSLVAGLRMALSKMDVQQVYAPNVAAMSARIVETQSLKECIPLGGEIHLYRDQTIPADGVFLKPYEAFVMSGAGCPVIIATGNDLMVVAHSGRDSLIEPEAIWGEHLGEQRKRLHLSVVDAIVDAFKKRGIAPSKVTMTMHFSIPTAVFEHRFDEKYRAFQNRALLKFVRKWPGCTDRVNVNGFLLSLEELFKSQARQAGVGDISVANNLSELPALAHTRDGKNHDRRNLIVVKRCS